MLLRADLERVVNDLNNRNRTPNGILIIPYRATPSLAIWELCATRNPPGAPSPNSMLLAQRVDDTQTSFTVLPFRHTFPDEPSRLAWGWCGNLFLAWRWIHYSQLEPFLLNDTGEFQYTPNEELRAALKAPAVDEDEFKQARRQHYFEIYSGDRLDDQINLEWRRCQALYRLRMIEMENELKLREHGEQLTFQAAADQLLQKLSELSPQAQLLVANGISLNEIEIKDFETNPPAS